MLFLLEAEQQANEAAVTLWWQCANERRVTPVLAATDTAAVALSRLEAMGEVGLHYLYGRKEPIEMPPWAESEQQAVEASKLEADGATATSLRQSSMKKV